MPPCILGIETSCDETAAAVVTLEGQVLASTLSSQDDVHRQYGGVVPELASRRHVERIEFVVKDAMDHAGIRYRDLQAVAVTRGPGLAGSLVVGVSFAKAVAYAANVPLIGVNHLGGHVASAWLGVSDLSFPCVVLVASGGHTHLFYVPSRETFQLIGHTLDDAAGEAFDKGAKMLGLGYPGGPELDRLARSGNCTSVHFPRPYLKRGGLNFSFSGLKTALLYYLKDLEAQGIPYSVADIAAAYQEAIVEVLVAKAFRAIRQRNVKGLAVVGGVSANSRLREVLTLEASAQDVNLALPPLEYCTDNAAMIAAAGCQAFRLGDTSSWDLDVEPDFLTSLKNGVEVSTF